MLKIMPDIRFEGNSEPWEPTKLKNKTVKIGSGKTPRGGSAVYTSSGIPLLRSQNVYNDQVYLNNVVYISQETDREMTNSRVEKGDVLLNITGASIGRSAVYRYNELANVNQHVCIVRPRKQESSDFIQLNISSPRGQKNIQMNQAGGGREGLNFKQISKIKFFYPSLQEQEKITILFQELNRNIDLNQHALNLLKQRKKAFLQKMYPKKGESSPEIRFSGFTKDWKKKKLNQLGEISTGKTPSTSKKEYYDDNGMLWVTPTDISGNITTNTSKRLSLKGQKEVRVVPSGSILVTCIASIGKNTMVTQNVGFNQQINAVSPNKEHDSYFLLTQSYFWSRRMRLFASKGTMQIVNKGDFSNLTFKIPSLEEQEKIGNFFKELDNSIALQEEKLESLKQMKKAFLQKLFV